MKVYMIKGVTELGTPLQYDFRNLRWRATENYFGDYLGLSTYSQLEAESTLEYLRKYDDEVQNIWMEEEEEIEEEEEED